MYKKTEYGKRIFAISAASSIMLMLLFVSGAPQASAATTNVTFDASYYTTVSGSFGAAIVCADSTVTPGGEVEIDFTAEQGTASLTLNLGTYGGSYTLNTDTPLGTTHIPLTSITVADVGVDITGRMDSNINVSGPGSVNMQSLSWSTWGVKTVVVDASNAEAGDTILLTMSLEYVVNIGASAVIDIFGFYTQTIDIFDVDLGSLPASQTIQVQIDVESAGFDMMLIIIILIIIIVAVTVAVLAMKMKKAPPVQPQQQYNQQYPPQPGQQYPPQDPHGQQYRQYPPPPPGQ